MQAAESRFLKNIGFMITYKCTIACPHCIVEAGPHRKEEMALPQFESWLTQARNYRLGHIEGLAITGGEPFENLERLTRIVDFGDALGFSMSLVTNAFWATSRRRAIRTLARVRSLKQICFSTDVYHQKSIPFDNIRYAVEAAKELGHGYSIAVCTGNERDEGYRRILRDLEEMGEAGNIRPSITFPLGRALAHAGDLKFAWVSKPTVSACCMAGSPVVFPNGDVNACIGPVLALSSEHPLHLGNLNGEPLARILERAELNSVLHVIRVWGPSRLVDLLRQHGYARLLPDRYIENCICDICCRLFSDPAVLRKLEAVFRDGELQETIAYGRLYYLKEDAMREATGMNSPLKG